MKNNLYFLILWPLLNFTGNTAYSQALPELRLTDAIERGIKNNNILKAAEKDILIAQTQNTKAATGYYPLLSLNAQHTHSIQNTELKFFDGREIVQSGAYSNNTNAGLSFFWTIVDFGRRDYIKAQLELIEASQRAVYIEEIERTTYRIAQNYMNALRLQMIREQLQLQLTQSIQRSTLAEAIEDRGTGTRLASLQAKVNVQQDSLLYESASADYELAKLELLSAMNETSSYTFRLDTGQVMNIQAPLKEALVNQMEKSSPTAQRLELAIAAAEKRKKESNAQYYPELNLISTLNFNLSNNQANFVIQSSNFGPAVGINLSYPIFDNGLRKRQVETAGLEMQRNKHLLEDWRLQSMQSIQIALTNSEQQELLAIRQQQAIALFSENYTLSEESFRRGRLTDIELREAQLALSRAKISERIHILNSKQAIIDAYFLSGNCRQLLGLN